MKPIFVAIDTPDVHRAASIARDVLGIAGGMKLGLEFFCANGHEGVLRVAEHGMPIFLDLKFHDIPNTVGKAVEAIARLSPAILTVHAAGGREMMAAAKAAAPRETKVVAGLITLFGYGTLMSSSYPPLRSMGVVSIVSVTTLVAASLLILPALLPADTTAPGSERR